MSGIDEERLEADKKELSEAWGECMEEKARLREMNAGLKAENARLSECVSELMHTLRMKVIRETQDLAMQKEAIAKAEKLYTLPGEDFSALAKAEGLKK